MHCGDRGRRARARDRCRRGPPRWRRPARDTGSRPPLGSATPPAAPRRARRGESRTSGCPRPRPPPWEPSCPARSAGTSSAWARPPGQLAGRVQLAGEEAAARASTTRSGGDGVSHQRASPLAASHRLVCTWQDEPTSSIVHLAMNVVAPPFLRGDLLDPVLEDQVVVGCDERLVVGDVHLVLPPPRLALGESRRGCRRPASRCGCAAGRTPRVTSAAAGSPQWSRCAASAPSSPWRRPPRRSRLKRKNSSSVALQTRSPRSAARSSWRRRICRGDTSTGVPSSSVRSQMTRAVPSSQGMQPGGGVIRAAHEVAVTGVPVGEAVTRQGVHIDVHGQQVVARLYPMVGHMRGEEVSRHPLSHRTPVHVGERHHDGVDGSVGDTLIDELASWHAPC